jgi:hypothetical protein
MNGKDELLFAVRSARRDLKEGKDFRASEMLALLEGMAPFLDKDTVINLKCRTCDSYAKACFPLENDFWAVDQHEHCHAKSTSLAHLSLLKIAGCTEYSRKAQTELAELAASIVEEDLRSALAKRKLYDRKLFASYNLAFRICQDSGKVSIEFGHKSKGEFLPGDARIHLLRRLDPGFGAEVSERIAELMKDGPVMVVEASPQIRQLLDIDCAVSWIAQKRKMDIVYL